MPEYVPTGHHVFCGGKRIDFELISPNPEPAIIEAPTLAELNIEEDIPEEDFEAADAMDFEDASDETAEGELPEETDEEASPQESPEEIAARLAEDRIKAQQVNLEVAAELAAELGVNDSDAEPVMEDTVDTAAPAEESPEEIAARLAADRVHAQEANLEIARSVTE